MIGLVLAGGRSRRFGSPKAEALVGGRRLVDRAAGVLREAGLDVFVAGGAGGNWATGLPVLEDVKPQGGPLAALAPALERGDVFALACDLPGVDAALVQRLVRSLEGVRAVIATCAGREQPLCAAYVGGNPSAAMAALEQGGSMRRFIAPLTTLYIEVPRQELVNLNTMADLESWEALP